MFKCSVLAIAMVIAFVPVADAACPAPASTAACMKDPALKSYVGGIADYTTVNGLRVRLGFDGVLADGSVMLRSSDDDLFVSVDAGRHVVETHISGMVTNRD